MKTRQHQPKPLKRLFSTTIVFIAVLSLASCKKDTNGTKNDTQSELLTASTWKITVFEWRTTKGKWVNAPENSWLPQTITFFDTNTYASSYSSGAWQFSKDGKQLTIFGSGGGSSTLDIAALTATKLQFSEPMDSVLNYLIVGDGPNKTYINCDYQRTTYGH